VDQLSLFQAEHPVVGRLREVDLERLTPIEAMNFLAELRAAVRGE
jgi:hypothetical protein